MSLGDLFAVVVDDPQAVREGLEAVEPCVILRAARRIRLRELLEIRLGALERGDDLAGNAGTRQDAHHLPVHQVEEKQRAERGHDQRDEAPADGHGDSTVTGTVQEYVINERWPIEAARMAP